MSDGKIPASPIGRPRTSGVDRGQLHMACSKVLERTIRCGWRPSQQPSGPGRNYVHSANWALSSLPKYISAEAVQCVLDQCDRQTAVGRRNYAVLLLLARLGMRGGEVLRLNLEDIDWHNA